MKPATTTLARVRRVQGLLAVPPQFMAIAASFPAKVDQALALIDNVQDAAKLLHEADTLAHFAARVKADTKTVNYIQYGKLKIAKKVSDLTPRGKGGRGKKNHHSACDGFFHKNTLVSFHKVADHATKFNDYWKDIEADGEAEMSIAGFIRYVASDGNIKSHQNKGVIEWYTPAEYVDAARSVMDSIDLDPASNKLAQKVVKAGKFYSKDDDGLTKDWRGTVFLNPPFVAALAKAFITKLCESHQRGDVTQAVLLTNNNTDTAWWHEAAKCCACICFTEGRIAFYSPAGEIAQPTNGHTLFYFGRRLGEFQRQFKQFGSILQLMER